MKVPIPGIEYDESIDALLNRKGRKGGQETSSSPPAQPPFLYAPTRLYSRDTDKDEKEERKKKTKPTPAQAEFVLTGVQTNDVVAGRSTGWLPANPATRLRFRRDPSEEGPSRLSPLGRGP